MGGVRRPQPAADTDGIDYTRLHKEVAIMREDSSMRKDARFGWALAALALASIIPLPAWGADRMVIAEEFSNVG